MKLPANSPAPYGALPNRAQVQWHEMESYAFLHFGLNTFTGKEWGYGDESEKLFNPVDFDADKIVGNLKAAGFRCVSNPVRLEVDYLRVHQKSAP